MNAQSRELLRLNLLRQLDAVAPSSLRVSALHVGTFSGGFDVQVREVEAELGYLADKGLVKLSDKAISPEIKHWQVTAAGRDLVAQQGLA